MNRWLLALAGVAIAARALGSERVADTIRWADQRLELFSPRGAGIYARVAPRILPPLYRAVAEHTADTGASRVLDVGTGPGALAIEIARRCPRCQVVGVDLAPEMLATAGARAAEAGVADRVRFQIADASALPLADGSIDVAVSTLSLHHWRDPAAVLRELHRVLQRGGQALIYDLRFSYSRRQFAAFADATPFGSAAVSYTTLRGRFPVAVYARYALAKAAAPEPIEA
jgi:SAM-dependent methyltransferase